MITDSTPQPRFAGHIQANRSNLRPRDRFDRPTDLKSSGPGLRAPDQGILDHERKRRVEIKCLELQLQLEDDGVEEGEVEAQVSALRASLLAQSASAHGAERDVHSIKPHERHEVAQAKERANERLRSAMGISKDHVEGLAFDRDAQARLKIERQEERARQQEERRKVEAELQVEREKARKLRDEQQAEHRREMDDQRRRHQQELDDARRSHQDRLDTQRKDDLKKLDDELDQRQFGRAKRDRSASPPRARSKTPPGFRRTRPREPSPAREADRDRDELGEAAARGRSLTRSPSRSRSRSPQSGGPRSRSRSRSRSPAGRRAKSYSRSRSPSGSRSLSRSRSPPRTRARRDSPSRGTSRSPRSRS